jgi:hypothetical protein
MIVEEYLKLEQTDRQDHLDLSEDCLLRGGNSTNHRGVLAQYLNTPIYGRPADLCHACHIAECSNPKHLYWGTRAENVKDARDNGTYRTPFEYAVEKFYEGRLDLISSVFYDEPRWWWLIAQYNNMTDPISETTEGRIIYIPSKDRLQLMLMTVTGGSPSTKQSINTISPIIS